MTDSELQALLAARYPRENAACEWKEFKTLTHAVMGRKGEDVISYVSALANMGGGHLVLGIEDSTLRIVGIQDFGSYTPENFCQRILGRCTHLDSEGLRLEAHTTDDTGLTVWILHVPCHQPRLPVYAHDCAWQRLGDSLTKMRQERLDAILNEPIERVDWTAQLVPGATIADLDAEAIALARKQFKDGHDRAPFRHEVDEWDTATFLDKAKLSVHGQLTRAALLLLGNESGTHRLSPHPAQITWKLDAEERAYEHFSPPFLLTTTRVLRNIRNVNLKLFPSNQLIPTEVMKYDTRVILEALHNALAHQDYERQSRITVTEKTDRLIFENEGGFFEGDAEDYFAGERTPSRYRNPWLVQAMVQLGMIDSMGYGIYTMTKTQRERFFPLPDYSRSSDASVMLEIYGHTLDPNYSLLLMERADLPLQTVISLDRVQKRLPISDTAAQRLRREGLIEGRKPNYYVSAHVASLTGTQATYTRNRGLDKAQLKQFVIDHLRQFKTTSRERLDLLLVPMMPLGLSDEQKRNRVKNLLTEMRGRDRTIICEGKGPRALWRLVASQSSKSGGV